MAKIKINNHEPEAARNNVKGLLGESLLELAATVPKVLDSALQSLQWAVAFAPEVERALGLSL